jgi:hypothetical protein
MAEAVALYRSQDRRTESIGNNPDNAPHSVVIFAIVRRSSIDSAHCFLGSSKFNGVIKDFVVVEEAAECNNNIFPCNTNR